MSPSKVLPWLLVLGVFVAGLFAVWHFFPRIETKAETVVVTDSAAVHIQAIRIDSLQGVIDSMKVDRNAFAGKEKKKLDQAIAFYKNIIASLEAKGDSITVPKASADQDWITTAEVRSQWTDGEGNVNVRDTTVNLCGTTHAQYAFPPANQFNIMNEVHPFEIPYPLVRTTTVKTESRISWEWIVIPSCVAFAAGIFLARK